VGNVPSAVSHIPSFVGSDATTPIPNATPGDPCLSTGFTCLFIPAEPNSNFGLARTMLNPRQFQFAAKFSF